MYCNVKVACKEMHQGFLIYSIEGVFTVSEIQRVVRNTSRDHDQGYFK